MATVVNIAQDASAQVDLGNSNNMVIAVPGAQAARVYVDYQRAGSVNYTSAVKGSAGYNNPFPVAARGNKTVNKTDLESEHVRVSAENANITVTY